MDGEREFKEPVHLEQPLGLPQDDVFHLTLKRPIKLGNQLFESLTFREPTALDLRKSAAGVESPTHQIMVLAQLVGGVPMRVIEQMAASDYAKVAAFLNDLMIVDRATGPS